MFTRPFTVSGIRFDPFRSPLAAPAIVNKSTTPRSRRANFNEDFINR